MNIQWYPGHMTKTRRQMEHDLPLVDLVVELIDARIPISSRNPDLETLAGKKPRLLVLNRADQADPKANQIWLSFFQEKGCSVLTCNAKTGEGIAKFPAAVRTLLQPVMQRWKEKGQVGRPIRAMIAGIPNVGKSTFINRLSGRKAAQTEDRPGVTRGRQWITVDAGLSLLDTPGILWPKFDDERVGRCLAYTGAIRDQVLDVETLACHLMSDLVKRYPGELAERYKLDQASLSFAKAEENPVVYGAELLEAAAGRRGFRAAGGGWNTERMACVLLDEFRGGKLGRLTLELPKEEMV